MKIYNSEVPDLNKSVYRIGTLYKVTAIQGGEYFCIVFNKYLDSLIFYNQRIYKANWLELPSYKSMTLYKKKKNGL